MKTPLLRAGSVRKGARQPHKRTRRWLAAGRLVGRIPRKGAHEPEGCNGIALAHLSDMEHGGRALGTRMAQHLVKVLK